MKKIYKIGPNNKNGILVAVFVLNQSKANNTTKK